jgi:uncharacterized protein
MIKQIVFYVSLIMSKFLFASDFEAVDVYLQNGQEDLAVEMAVRHAEANSSDAAIYTFLGYAFLDASYGVDHDLNKAINYLQKASQMGDSTATFELALIYLNNHYVGQDCAMGIGYLEEAVEKGNIGAQAVLAENYAYGYCVAQNYEVALELLKQPFAQGHMIALAVLGTMNFHGAGVPEDTGNAIMLWQQAAEQGHCDSLYNLGAAYDNGVGVDVDLEKAFEIFSDASEGGCLDSSVALAHMYYLGRHVEQNDEIAFAMYFEAYSKGDIEAQSEVAQMLLRGEGTKQNVEQGKELLLDAANKGFDRAQTKLAGLYFTGQEFEQSYTNAYFWFKKAAYTDPFAQSGLGYLYEYGLHGTKNEEKAAYYYSEALKQGNVDAVISLARMYFNGKYFAKDEVRAKELLNKWQHTDNDRIVATLGILLSCADSPAVSDPNLGLRTIEAHIAEREYYHYELKLAKAAAYASLDQHEKSMRYLSKIKDVIYNEENTFRIIENHFAKERFDSLLDKVSRYEGCSLSTTRI